MNTPDNPQMELIEVAVPATSRNERPNRFRSRPVPSHRKNVPLLSDDDQPLRIKTVAEWLGVADKTVRRRIDSGEIKSVKMGGLRMILRRDLRSYWQKLNPTGGDHV